MNVSDEAQKNIIVLKFGSSVLRTWADLPNAVHEIYRWYRLGYEVLVVVSAIGLTTDELLCEARTLSSIPEPYATAELLATGERTSAALLALALDRAGIPSRVLNPREIGLTVAGPPLDSDLVSVDAARLQQLVGAGHVLVVAGFFGTDAAGRTHCLGRGGSDLTAVFLSHTLDARCRLIKDVDGVYDGDPAAGAAEAPRRFESLSYADALRVAGPLIQPKAVRWLREHGTTAEVAALTRGYASRVHSGPTRIATTDHGNRRLQVLLLGVGTVGFGVYQRLLANADLFEIAGCLVRDRAKYQALGIPADLLYTNPTDALRLVDPCHCDVVVDASPGVEPSRLLAEQALSVGISVVSANKVLVCEHGATLHALAKDFGARLLYSAAVGGAAPMLELIDHQAARGTTSKISAVLNGTCNFILDACANGATLGTAIADAQRAGFAEGDATEDLAGRDAARKLRILSRRVLGAEPESIDIEVLDKSVAQRTRELGSSALRLRQIAHATREGERVQGRVTFEALQESSLFGSLTREWNALELTDAQGNVLRVSGRGAGRWPTTEAVMGDLFDIRRSRLGETPGLHPL